jgi:hypothetical protein
MVIRLGEHVIERAQDLLEIHTLRAYDSVQLASALEANHHLMAAGITPAHFRFSRSPVAYGCAS